VIAGPSETTDTITGVGAIAGSEIIASSGAIASGNLAGVIAGPSGVSANANVITFVD
jgi:hypothetical protein